MKLKIVIDKNREEEILVYAHAQTPLVEEIKHLVEEELREWIGYRDKVAMRLNLADICCFSVENNKVYAHMEKERLQIKLRLYQLEEKLDQNFVKINQSCIANIKQIERFEVAIGGALGVVFKNGHRDYVSRRNLKTVKERLGLS